MKDPTISVIVPIYNVERYVKNCINSILAQTFQDFEIIIVDDASTDNSHKICRELSKGGDKIRIIRHEKNLGLGPARNTGIVNAIGKYIYFVDSDDEILPQTLEIFYSIAEKSGADTIHPSSNYENIFPKNSDGFFLQNITNRIEFLNRDKNFDSDCDFYRREFLTENKIEFPADCPFQEKAVFQLAALCLAKKYLVFKDLNYVKHLNDLPIKTDFFAGIKSMSIVVRYMDEIFNKVPDTNSALKEKCIGQVLEKILKKHIRPFYQNPMNYEALDKTAYQIMLPAFGANTIFVNYFFQQSNMLWQQADFFTNQNKKLNEQLNQINQLLHSYMEENSKLTNLLDEFNRAKTNIPRTFENLCRANYEYIEELSHAMPRAYYDELIDKIFKATVEKIRRKDKIKLAFVTRNASMWCGDKLYNYFAENPRYDVKVFLSDDLSQTDAPEIFKDLSKSDFPEVKKDFLYGVEQFKSHGINVVGLDNVDAQIDKQDVIILLNPYLGAYPRSLYLSALTAETLLVNIPYGVFTTEYDIYNMPLIRVLWKNFFETKQHLLKYEKNCNVAVHGYYSGYPRLDVLLDKNSNWKYDWKMITPNAKKIIWAPHWTIGNLAIQFSTFEYNYKFFYELARANPQTSWVVKPHPHLFHSAIESGLFSSNEAFEEYLQAWNNLPNAKVEKGAYYHEIFATSDAMILDCDSFTVEYQYTHKPMIFLTRDTQRFNDLGKALSKVTYRVDGRDLNGIAKIIKKVIIDGVDDMYDERLKFFEKYCDYVKENGMLASEYIYKNITQELDV